MLGARTMTTMAYADIEFLYSRQDGSPKDTHDNLISLQRMRALSLASQTSCCIQSLWNHARVRNDRMALCCRSLKGGSPVFVKVAHVYHLHPKSLASRTSVANLLQHWCQFFLTIQ